MQQLLHSISRGGRFCTAAFPEAGGGAPQGAGRRRGGAVIILSLALLMTLMFLGLFFFSFVDDESLSADIYARQSRARIDVSNKHVLNHGLSQVLVGTNDSDPDQQYYARYSALAGGRYSILASLIGPIGEHDWNHNATINYPTNPAAPDNVTDGDPYDEDLDNDGYYDPWTPVDAEKYNGGGMRVFDDGTGTFYLELNGDKADIDADGTADRLAFGGPNPLVLNGSELAGGALTRIDGAGNMVGLDVGYTYPDLNSLFLYHEFYDVAADRWAIKPSFDVPGIFYAQTGYTQPALAWPANQVLRPHSQQGYGGTERYLTSAVTAASGDTTRTIQPFDDAANPFDGNYLYRYPSGINDLPGAMGVWNDTTGGAIAKGNYDFHVDADNDGVNDAFLVDLDYPLISFPDGRQAVPMYFWKIEDLDALINLNTAGDMPLYRLAERQNVGAPPRNTLVFNLFNDPRFLTGGNQGNSPSEINPGVALYVDPADTRFLDGANEAEAREQFSSYYQDQAGFSAMTDMTTDVNRLQLANTELLWLMTGRNDYDNAGVLPEDYDLPGRYGEVERVVAGSQYFPAPGTTGLDDDRDGNNGRRPNGGAAYRERFPNKNGSPQARAVAMPPAVHPLDATGHAAALFSVAGDAGMHRQFRSSSDTNNPSQWLYYNATNNPQFGAKPMWQFPVGGAAGVTPWIGGGGSVGYLQANDASNPVDALRDEPDELIVDDTDPNFANPDDEPFRPSEIAGLHASGPDWDRLNVTSRIRNLAPVNFEVNYLAEQIRKQFTTTSWDRPEFSIPYNRLRTWEFGDATPVTTSTLEFPPKFGSVNATPPGYNAGNIVGNDPLRPELRRLLYVNFDPADFGSNRHPQCRLQLNGILSDDSLGGGGAASCFDSNGNPRFRPLVPHPQCDSTSDPTFTPAAMVHTNGGAVAFPFTMIGSSKEAQEWWARHDRQRLARDIYTLLWMFGSRPDLNNDGSITAADSPVGATNPYATFPDDDSDGIADMIEEMAQFAVNVVDAMDHDNVITRFEFDPNLNDGWSWAAGGDVKYGLEAQSLTFSEALWVKTHVADAMGNAADHLATLYDDAAGDKHFLFLELRNALPFDITLATDSYRISRLDSTGAVVASITFEGQLTGAATSKVGPGENFLIGTHSGGFTVVGGTNDGKNQAAVFWLDHQHDSMNSTDLDYTPAIPYLTATHPTGTDAATARQSYPAPLCDLDLCHDRDVIATDFKEANGNPSGGQAIGYFLSGIPDTDTNFTLVLERRLNTRGDGCITQGTEWVETDRVTVQRKEFILVDMDPAATVRTNFSTNIVSQERREPFYAHEGLGTSAPLYASTAGDGLVDYASTGVANAFYKHSLGGPLLTDTNADPLAQAPPDDSLKHQRNSVLPDGTQFQIWQPHFDRGFTSVYDLLSVQLLAPWQLIYHDQSTTEGGLVVEDSTRMQGLHTAGVRFENPEVPGSLRGHLGAVSTEHYANAWYRLLEFLSVPSHTSDEIADDMQFRRRIPGRVNINTLRDEHVLGAVINDQAQLTLFDVDNPTDDNFFTPAAMAPDRNWYNELRRTRDGDDGTLGGAIYPPGTPYANPIRPLTWEDSRNATIATAVGSATTMLRRGDGNGAAAMDQIGLFGARNPADVSTDQVDFHTRQRILSRIANLTTNRSHVYLIWGGFQLHEAHDADTTGNSPQIQIGQKMTGMPMYRELIVVDMSRMEEAFDTATGAYNFGGFILHREVLP